MRKLKTILLVGAAIAALAGTTFPAIAKTFVYVSNAEDGDIDAYVMDGESGALSSIGKMPAGIFVDLDRVIPKSTFFVGQCAID